MSQDLARPVQQVYHTLLADARTARSAGLAARKMVDRQFSWSRMAGLLAEVLAGAERSEVEVMKAFSAESPALSPTALPEEAFSHAAS